MGLDHGRRPWHRSSDLAAISHQLCHIRCRGQSAMTETALKQTAMANRPAARTGAVPGWTRSRQTAALWTFVALGLGWIWGLLWVGATVTLHPACLGTVRIIITGFVPSLAAVCVLRMSEGPRACGSGCAAAVAEFFGLSMPHSSNSALHVMSGSSQRNAQMKKGRSFTPATLLL